jgi:FHA domain
MSAAGGPGRTLLCRECGATTDADDSSPTCRICDHANFEECPAESGQAGDPAVAAGPPPAAAGPAARPAPGAGDQAAAGLLPPGERWLQLAFEGDSQSWQLEIAPGEEVELGRDPGYSPHAADLAADDTVSRRHAVLGLDVDGSAWIRDVGSANGTCVNHRRLPQHPNHPAHGEAKHPLRNGDRLKLGLGTLAKVRFVPAPGAADHD